MRRVLRLVLGPSCVLALALALGSPLARARAEDVVTKTDGGKLRGTVILDTPDLVKIKTAAGVITLTRDEVASVERAKDVFRELGDRRADCEKARDAKRWMELGRWCQDKELWADAIDCFWKVVKLDPDQRDARFELGFRRLDGRWLTEAEYFQAKGYVRFEGRWVTPEDKEKLDAGLVKVGDDWITRAEADARAAKAAADAEQERRGIPGGARAGGDSGGDAPAPAEPKAQDSPAAPAAPKGPANPLGRRPRRDPGADAKPLSPEERKAALESAKQAGNWKLAYASKHYDFFSNGSSVEELQRFGQAMDAMCEEYKRIFAYKGDLTRPFPIWLYADQREFMERTGKGQGVGGFYDGEKIVAFHGLKIGNFDTQTTLFHEGTHQFENLIWGDHMWEAKIWLIEGLAVYFESSEVDGKNLRQMIPVDRLNDVRRAIQANDYIHLSDLIRMEQAQFGALHYAHAWSLIYFLCWGTKDGKERFKKYCDGVKEGKDGVKLFEELFNRPMQQIEDAWKQYVLNLR